MWMKQSTVVAVYLETTLIRRPTMYYVVVAILVLGNYISTEEGSLKTTQRVKQASESSKGRAVWCTVTDV